MKYSEVLTKRAATPVTPEDITAVKDSPEFNAALQQAFAKPEGALNEYASRVSPGEIMRIALGATAGGGLGWLASRLLHRKPKAWRTALYTLGGAGIGGFGTHWYINNAKDDEGKTIAEKDRFAAAKNDPRVDSIAKRIAEADRSKKDSGYDPDNPEAFTRFLPKSDTLGFYNDPNGWLTGAAGAGTGYVSTGFGYQLLQNYRHNRKYKLLNTLITNANRADAQGIQNIFVNNPGKRGNPPTTTSVSLSDHFINLGGKHKGRPYIQYNPDATPGKRFSLDFRGESFLQGELVNGVRKQKHFSRGAGVLGSIPGFLLSSYLGNSRRKAEYEAAEESRAQALKDLPLLQ